MKYCNAVIPVLAVLLVGLLIMWNLGNTQIKPHFLRLPVMKAMFRKNTSHLIPNESIPNKPNETATRLLYGDGTCGDNDHRASFEKILKQWLHLASTYKINYTLSFGSLIGAYRNYDVIPWDHDMDILINYDDILKLDRHAEPRNFDLSDGEVHMTVIPKSQHNVSMDDRKRWTCHNKETPDRVDQCSIQEPLIRIYHHWTFLDVFYYVDNGGEFLISNHENKIDKFRRTDIFPLKPCSFLGMMCMCANNAKNVLTQLYGAGFEKPNKVCRKGSWVHV